MAGFGGLGGRGGFGASFPTRNAMPNSNVVESVPFGSRQEWQADFDRRWADANRAPTAEFRPTGSLIPDYVAFDPQGPQLVGQDAGGRPTPWDGVPTTPSSGPTLVSSGMPTAATSGSTLESYIADYSASNGGTAPTFSDPWSPNLSALEAERSRMPGMYDAFERNTQAYNNMGGRGMMNGILSEGYSSPTYGRVSTAGNGAQTPDTTGLNMDWTGVYNPTSGSGAVGQRRRWGQ